MKPIDIEMKKFKKTAFGGYNVADVNELLDEVFRNYHALQCMNTELEQKVKDLSSKVGYYKKMEITLQNTMILAEKTSQETRAKAAEEAEEIILEGTLKSDKIIEGAREEAYALKQDIIRLNKQYEDAKKQIKELLESQLESLDCESIVVEEISSISEDLVDEIFYTKEYQIIDEEDVI